MEFEFDAEQRALRATVQDLLRAHRGRTSEGFDRALWRRLTGELGLTALGIPEEHGGFGASLVEVGIALEEAGAALLTAPLLSTAVAAAALDPGYPAAADLLPRLAAGTSVATLALAEPAGGWIEPSCTARPDGGGFRLDGVKEHVLDGDVADVFVVSARCADGPALFTVQGHPAASQTTLDQTRGQARLMLDGTPARLVAAPGPAVAHALDLLHAALAVESVGVARASLCSTVDYLRVREQFGVPLATFQALRHRVADLSVALEQATSSAWYALRVAGTEEFAVAAPMAKLVAADVAFEVTAAAIQLHGGIGFTWEHDAHRYLKRATANRLLAGDAVALRRIVAARAGLGTVTVPHR